MRKMLALLVVPFLFLMACEPVEGTVVDKEFEKGEMDKKTRTEHKQKCTGSGTNRKCKNESKKVKYKEWDDQDWVLIVEDKNGDKHEVEVSEKTYNSFEVGDHFKEK